jgi:hypothetical protein
LNFLQNGRSRRCQWCGRIWKRRLFIWPGSALERIPLAHRITLAGRAQIRGRELLRHDPSPLVIEALARNPQLSIPEIRVMLRDVRMPPPALECLGRDPRWRDNDEVKTLIAFHPRVPASLAARMIASVGEEAAQRALQHPRLNPTLRARLNDRLGRR